MQDWKVQLCRAPIPGPLGKLAVHCWFNVLDPRDQAWHRWEVWQHRDVRPQSWGHVHRDLMRPMDEVGGGLAVVDTEWQGKPAERIAAALATPERYPYRYLYLYWPGPNSNTYVAWILRQAGVSHVLPRQALGKAFPVR